MLSQLTDAIGCLGSIQLFLLKTFQKHRPFIFDLLLFIEQNQNSFKLISTPWEPSGIPQGALAVSGHHFGNVRDKKKYMDLERTFQDKVEG